LGGCRRSQLPWLIHSDSGTTAILTRWYRGHLLTPVTGWLMPRAGLESYFGLSGKVVLLTGATGGIGGAMATAFAAAGASLVLTSNDAGPCEALATELREDGAPARAYPCDALDRDALTALVSSATTDFGRIDVLIANAGIVPHSGPLGSADDAAWDLAFGVNLRPAAHLAALVAPGMAARRDGAIVLTSSIAALRGNKALGLYALTKAALAQLARNLAVEWGPFNVRANALAPGLIATSWAGAILSDAEAIERRLGLTPLRRIGEPSEVAAAALFLASPGGAFITGQTLVVDGGTVISDGN
jgi:NAD(P)-dependent dehydrogenase (short-subunit alcohol dehydrogenase family)